MRFPIPALIILAAAVFAPAHALFGGVPERLPFQNFLVDSDGKPLGSGPAGESSPRNYDVIFRIHPRSSGSDILWAEQQTVTIDRGLLSVQLGEGLAVGDEPNAPLSEIFRGIGANERYLSTTIRFSDQSADFEILPRIRLLGNPGAILSAATRSIAGSGGRSLLSITGDTATVDGNLQLSAPLSAPSLSGSAISLSGIDASAFTTGTISSEFVPTGLNASLITGALAPALFPAVLPSDKIGALNASSITSGTLNADRLPDEMVSTTRSASFIAPVVFNEGLTVGNDLVLGFGPLYLGEPGNEDFGLQVREVPSVGSRTTTLWGKDGGVLGDRRYSDRAALSWNSNNEVTIHRPLFVPGLLAQQNSSPGRHYRLRTSGLWWESLNFQTLFSRSSWSTSIDADGLVLANAFYAFSDERIKKEVASSDQKADAALVDSLRVVDYRMKDRLLQGDAPRRGFIAQEVAELLPGAVTRETGILPDSALLRPQSVEREESSGSLRIKADGPHGLQPGDRVRLLTSEKTMEVEILTCPGPMTFTVRDPGGPIDALLILGRETHDLHVLDSDQIFSTTLSAIQHLMTESAAIDGELAKIEQELAEIESLDTEVRRLTRQLAAGKQAIPASHRPASTSKP